VERLPGVVARAARTEPPQREPDPLVGQTLSHYRILERLGQGGMGVVYKAQDTRLDRVVALKFLSPWLLGEPEARERFLREAQAAARLDHPNICAIHEIHEVGGHAFIVMNFVEGQSLEDRLTSGPLPIREALELARQVGRGLSAAHQTGIVHRDIKPGNILLTSTGTAKIVDFGLAKLAAHGQLTDTGEVLGTVAYMSPEQVRGEKVDHRTDVWALGVVLFELLTGELPFRGGNDVATIYAILNRNPRAVSRVRKDVPTGVEKIVMTALARDLDRRYPDVEALLADLEVQIRAIEEGHTPGRWERWQRHPWTRPLAYGTLGLVISMAIAWGIGRSMGPSGIDSLAVLPLVNLSGDENQEYFSDGMTEALIDELGKIGALRVISRTSVMQYKNQDTPLPEIARNLDVDAVLEGSVTRAGDHVALSVRLIDVRRGREEQLWAANFERLMRQILDLRGEVARTIASEIRIGLAPLERERLAQHREVDPEVYDEYLRGVDVLKNDWSHGREAIEHFRRALQKDSLFAPAYAGIAGAYSQVTYMFPHEEAIAKGIPAATRALELDGTLGEAYAALGAIKFFAERDWIGPDREFQRALELNPNDPVAHLRYADYLLLSGRAAEGIAHSRRALELDPLTPTTNLALGWALLVGRRYEAALKQYEKTLTMLKAGPGQLTERGVYYQMVYAYFLTGRYDEAKKALARTWPLPDVNIWLEYASGSPDSARRMFRERGSAGSTYMDAETYALLGDYDNAFELLRKAFDVHDPEANWIKVDPMFDPMRSDPRYAELLEYAGIPAG